MKDLKFSMAQETAGLVLARGTVQCGLAGSGPLLHTVMQGPRVPSIQCHLKNKGGGVEVESHPMGCSYVFILAHSRTSGLIHARTQRSERWPPLGKKDKTSNRSQPLGWALRTNQFWIYKENERQIGGQINLSGQTGREVRKENLRRPVKGSF